MSDIKPQPPMKMVPKNALKQDVTLRTLETTAERLKNWGTWGPNDELGTLNYVKPADLIKAGSLVRKGKAFSLGLDFNQDGPQRTGWGGRFNPIHTMLATGTDAVAGRQEAGKLRYADDMVTMPLQCGTQWDGLGHLVYGEKMWNGYDARPHGRPRSSARHSALEGRGLPRGWLRHRQRRSRRLRAGAGRGGKAG